MNTLEGKLTAALRETGEEIAGESVPPLVLDHPRYRPRVRGGASRRRWLAHRMPRPWPRRSTVRQPFSTEDRTYGSAFA